MSDMEKVLTEHRMGRAIGYAVHCVCDSETGYSIDRFFAHQAQALMAAGYGKLAAITQWAVLHDNGNVWNYYPSREAAEEFAADMLEVDVEMVVASRNYYPAMHGEWEMTK